MKSLSIPFTPSSWITTIVSAYGRLVTREWSAAVLSLGIVFCHAWRTEADPVEVAPVEGVRHETPGLVALENAAVLPRPGIEWKKATILINDDRIVEVGEDVQIPSTARRIDMNGQRVYAGFIDAYAEVDVQARASTGGYWNSGVTPEFSVIAAGRESFPAQESYRRAGFVARLWAPAKGQIKGVSALMTTNGGSREDEIIQPRVAMHATLTVPFRWDSTGPYPSSPMGALTLVRQALYDASWYRDAWRVARSGSTMQHPSANTALAALNEADNTGMPWIIDASNERYFQRADRIGREFGLRVIVRGSGHEYRRIDDVARTRRGVIVPLSFPAAPDVSTREAALAVSLDRLMHWDLAPENPVRLARAGVDIAFTSDGLKSVREFWPALRRALHRGLSRDAALAALTTTPASWYGVANDMGTIERGKFASLTVASGDLFDVETKKPGKITEVWIQGKRHELEPSDPRDVRGKWTLTFVDPETKVDDEWTLIVRGSRRRLKGALKKGDASSKVQRIGWNASHLTLVADAKPFRRDGWVRISSVMTGDLSDGEIEGQGAWPDGTPLGVRLRYLGKDDPGGEETDQEAGDEEEGDQEEDDEGQPANKKELHGESGEKRERDPANPEIVMGESEGQAVDEAGSTTEEVDKIKAALYEPNQPLGAYGIEVPPEQPASVCFRHATIWTCAKQGTLEDATIVLERGLITHVGDDAARLPPGCLQIDCSGKHITPGIIDCHSHIATDSGLNEGSQAITAEVRIADFIDADDIAIYRQLAGGVTTANVLHGSANPIGGQNQVIKLRWGASHEELKFANAPAGIKFALGENVKQSNWGDRFTQRYPQTRMGVDEIVDDAFRRASEYARRQQAWKERREGLPPRRDLELEALAEVLAGTRWIHCHSYRQSEIMALMKTCDRHGVLIGTFQHILEGYKLADEMARRGIMGSAFSDWWAYKFEVYDAIPYAGALMHDAGVVVSFNSDDAELGRRLNLEASKAVRYGGVPPEEALKFVTLNPARQLRVDQSVGSLEPGKQADLAVWSGDPLSVMSICEQTWVDGRCYFDRGKARELEKRDSQRHAALVQRVLQTGAPQVKSEDEPVNSDELWPRADTFCHEHP